ncbi:FCD domain-containing protein [Paracoccus sp. 11-3]|uniref:FCD domain-containing protein n=2 Tax=Paracoccus amoyensis TaxID=2760093 RepID=A0A926GE28_9RHOB|nr:FCD domain-containing protein [Paracoccus amoyensis]
MPLRSDGDGKTLMASVYDRLRGDIVDGELRPGARLRFDELKESYGVGLSPLREALTRLAAEKLVILEEHKGFRVAPISRSDLNDLLFMRQEIESLAIRRAIERGDDQWESAVVATIHALGKRDSLTEGGHIDPEWERRHRAFHDSLVAACDSPRLLLYRQQLTDHADRYRKLSHHYSSSGRDHLSEHCALSDAVIARDADLANQLIRKHLLRTVEIILSGEDLQKTGFDD